MTKTKTGAPRVVDMDDFLAAQLENAEFRRHYEQRRMVLEVAIAVRAMRVEAGMTQKQLADVIGSSQSVIARLEQGRDQRAPRWDTLYRIAGALGKQLKLVFVAKGRSRRPTLVEVEDAA